MRIVPDGRAAPALLVDYCCPRCKNLALLDAYDGPPTCRDGHAPTFMEAKSLHHDRYPLADIEAMRTTKRTFS